MLKGEVHLDFTPRFYIFIWCSKVIRFQQKKTHQKIMFFDEVMYFWICPIFERPKNAKTKPRSHQIAEAVTSLGEKVENRPYLQALRDHLNWLKSISIQSPEIFAGPILMQKRSLNLKKWVSRPVNNYHFRYDVIN